MEQFAKKKPINLALENSTIHLPYFQLRKQSEATEMFAKQ